MPVPAPVTSTDQPAGTAFGSASFQSRSRTAYPSLL